MAYDGSELEAWKLAVARATAYVQSNASFQIQLFGFFSSAVVIGIGLSSDGANGQTDSLELSNKTFMLMYVVPLFSLMILYVSGYYFNRLTTQHVFIRLYGHNFDPLTYVKSADQLWDNFQNQNNVTHVRAVRYLFSSDYTGPYPAFFLLYIIVGLVSFFL